MNYMDNLKGKVYSLPAFRVRGSRMDLEDAFLVKDADSIYVLFTILHASFTGESRRYTYMLYSPSAEKMIEPESVTFQKLISRLPSLDEASKEGGTIDPIKMFHLEPVFDELLGQFVQNNGLTAEQMEQYQDYMNQMQAMQSPSFAAVYAAARTLEG